MSHPWLKAEAIPSHLGVIQDTLYAWIADRGMPAHEVGRLLTFQADQVDEWVRRGSPSKSTPEAAR